LCGVRERRCGWVRLGLGMFSLSVFSLSVFSLSVFSLSVFSLSVFSLSVFSLSTLPGEEGIHRQGAAPGGPLFVLFGSPCSTAQRAPMSRRAASIVGKMRTTRSRRRPRKPSGQALDRVRGPQASSVFWRKREYRGGVIEARFQYVWCGIGVASQRVDRCVQRLPGRRGSRGGENGVQPVVHPVAKRRRRLVDHVAPDVYTEGFLGMASPPDQSGERRLKRLPETFVVLWLFGAHGSSQFSDDNCTH